jgi:hypothetical protein
MRSVHHRNRQKSRAAVVVALSFGVSILGAPAPDPAKAAALVTMTGNVESFLNSLPLAGANTNAFVTPSDGDMTTWRSVVNALLAGQYQTAATLADPLGYDLAQFTDPDRGKTYYLLRERGNARGLGTVVYNPGRCRMLSFHAPHAGGDTNTQPESVALFLELNALSLLVPGTHRCANTQPSLCDGTTTACGGSTAVPYRISDVGHYEQTFFEAAHEELVKKYPELISVSVHGFGRQSGDPDVMISNGTSGNRPESLATDLADGLNKLFMNLGLSLKAVSCNQPGAADPRLCGGTNLQGRFVNGSTKVCTDGVLLVDGPEKFIHIEQAIELRQRPAPDRPVSWQIVIDAFAAHFPCQQQDTSTD